MFFQAQRQAELAPYVLQTRAAFYFGEIEAELSASLFFPHHLG